MNCLFLFAWILAVMESDGRVVVPLEAGANCAHSEIFLAGSLISTDRCVFDGRHNSQTGISKNDRLLYTAVSICYL